MYLQVPTVTLRYDCGYITTENDTLASIASHFRLYYWQDICNYNPNLEAVCSKDCVVFGRCVSVPQGLLIHVPAIVAAYFPRCELYDDLNGTEAKNNPMSYINGRDEWFWRFVTAVCVGGLAILVLGGAVIFLASRLSAYTGAERASSLSVSAASSSQAPSTESIDIELEELSEGSSV